MNLANSSLPSASLAQDKSVKRLLPWLVAVAFFMESLDTTVLDTATQPAWRPALRLPVY